MASTLAGFRLGEPVAEALGTCRTGHFVVREDDAGDAYHDVYCQGVPAPEPGIEGKYVTLGICSGFVCDITLNQTSNTVASYKSIVAVLTTRYGKPTDIVSSPPPDEETARHRCAGASELASTEWSWERGPSRTGAHLSCLDGAPWASLRVLDDRAIGHYRSMIDD